jgi:hypothetical protein
MKPGSRLVAFGLGAWFCFALAVGISGAFGRVSAAGLAFTLWTLTGLMLLAYWKIRAVNDWIAHIDLRWLVLFHVTRFVGFYFLVLCRRGQLPCDFAAPAGFGDIFIAQVAVLLIALGNDRTLRRMRSARKIYRVSLLVWNTMGLVDILFVVFSALRFGLRDWQSMSALREPPLSLLPTFLVPLIIASHVIIFIRLSRHDRLASASL